MRNSYPESRDMSIVPDLMLTLFHMAEGGGGGQILPAFRLSSL